MDSIITYLFLYNQYLLKIISQLLLLIAKYVPLKQWAYDNSHSPEYQKFKVDKLPKIFNPEPVDYKLLLDYYMQRYNIIIKPINRISENTAIPEAIVCPRCGAPHQYLYKNNGSKGQYECKVCRELFSEKNIYNRPLALRCPYCGNILVPKKERKHFRIYKCINSMCSYYRNNLRKLPKDLDVKKKHK